MRPELRERVAAALERRAALLAGPETNVARVFNGANDGLAGLVIEKLGPVLVAQLHAGALRISEEEEARELCAQAAEQLGAAAVYRKVFPKDRSGVGAALDEMHRDPHPWVGEPVDAELPVREHGLTYLVHPYDGFATGLFLDHRKQRQWVRELAGGKRVLNAFAYTCAFAVSAAAGGAAQVVNVDVSKKYLEWGKRNLAANGLSLEPHRFFAADIFEYFGRAERQGHRFDLVLLDPPTFGRARRPKRAFSLRNDLDALVERALGLLERGGVLHLSVNHRETTVERLRRAVENAARVAGQRFRLLTPPEPPEDFGDDPDAAKVVLGEAG